MSRHRKHNRHGFQNFGGRHTGEKNPVVEVDIMCLQWIMNEITARKECSIPHFDNAFIPIGSVYRHTLRQHGLIMQYKRDGYEHQFIGLTPAAQNLLKSRLNMPKPPVAPD